MVKMNLILEHHLVVMGVLVVLLLGAGCEPARRNGSTRLGHMETTTLIINGHTFRAWIAKTDKDIRTGLMHVTADELRTLPDGAERGMLFVFHLERGVGDGFYMKNVPIPLDIAFLRADGVIVTIRTMTPFDHRSTYPTGSYRCTLEVKGGLFEKLGIKEGDTVQIPEAVLNNAA